MGQVTAMTETKVTYEESNRQWYEAMGSSSSKLGSINNIIADDSAASDTATAAVASPIAIGRNSLTATASDAILSGLARATGAITRVRGHERVLPRDCDAPASLAVPVRRSPSIRKTPPALPHSDPSF